MADIKKKAEPEKQAAPAQESAAKKPNPAAGAIASIPVAAFRDWLFAYFFPAETFPRVADKPSLGRAAKTFALSGLVGGMAYGLYIIMIFILATLFLGSMNNGFLGGLASGAVGAVASVIIAFVVVLLYPIMTVVFGFIISAIYFALAKLLGGKGTYSAQTTGLSYFQAGMMLVMVPLVIFSAIPCAGIVFSLLAVAASAYGLYGLYAIIRVAHGLSTAKAAAVALIPPFLVFALVAIIYVFMLVISMVAR